MNRNTSELPVPTFIWDSLMATMKAQSRRLVDDIAKTLGQDPVPLWKEISKQQFGIYTVDLTEPTNETFQCQSYYHCGKIEKPCKRPVIFGKKFCGEHCSNPQIRPTITLQKLRLLKYFDDDEGETKQLYVNPATNEVLSMETLEVVGEWIHEEKQLHIFEKA